MPPSTRRTARRLTVLFAVGLASLLSLPAHAQKKKKKPAPTLTFPPQLPSGQASLTISSPAFLEAPATLRKGVAVARTAPTVDFLYFPGQDYPGRPWSVWGEGLAGNDKYYASIGDHLAPAGNALVFEYDPEKKTFRLLVDLRKLLGLPAGHYSPGKIHGRLDLGADGWLYFATHRGSTRVTTDAHHYKGDWIVRAHPASGKSEVVAHGPVPKHCVPASVVDPARLIFYGATTPGAGKDSGRFFAYDLKARKLLRSVADGPSRAMILARSTGRVYYVPGSGDSPLLRYDPARNAEPERIEGKIGLRAATQETTDRHVYTVSAGRKGAPATLHSFDTRSEKAEALGPAGVGTQEYVASIAASPDGKYLYYAPGAHGGSEADGAPLVQYDVRARRRKVIAFLGPPVRARCGCTLKGTYSVAVCPKGERVFITWNASRTGGRAWDCCALTVVHVPESERR